MVYGSSDFLDRESVLKKADVLHQVIKPGDLVPFSGPYRYSRKKLEELDRSRHGAVHRLQFGTGLAAIEDGSSYLLNTVFYFVGLLNRRYGLQIDPKLREAGDLSLQRRT